MIDISVGDEEIVDALRLYARRIPDLGHLLTMAADALDRLRERVEELEEKLADDGPGWDE